jgi:cyclophilin family peptidyl-prolyl cis-trans isomerase
MTSKTLLLRPRLAAPAAAALLASLLAACGGGGGDAGSAVTNLTVTSTNGVVGYGRNITLAVSGSGLDSTVTAAVEPGCFTMTRGTTTESSMSFTCRLAAFGDLRVRVRTAEGKELGTVRLDVPAPQVQFNARQGTTDGSFVVELDPVRAPKTVDNFLQYVNTSGCWYKDRLFHRVIKDFVVQGGGYIAGLQPATGIGAPIVLESQNGLKNLRGTIAMARTEAPNSATSQFYINVKDNPSLDYVSEDSPGYAVFGTVVSGQDKVDLLSQVPTMTKKSTINGQEVTFQDAPIDNVVITACGQIR